TEATPAQPPPHTMRPPASVDSAVGGGVAGAGFHQGGGAAFAFCALRARETLLDPGHFQCDEGPLEHQPRKQARGGPSAHGAPARSPVDSMTTSWTEASSNPI